MTLLVVLVAVPILLSAAWLGVLSLLSGAPPQPAGRAPPLFFDILVPARDEEAGIAETLRSLRALDWPASLTRIVVVADNCRDRTAQVARDEGAEVIRRDDRARCGKGFALAFGLSRCLAEGLADAVVVVDADSSVSPGLLRAFAIRLGAGARAIQAESGVRNAGASWRTGLLAIGLAAFNSVRSRGRSRLGLSCGLRGNGMCLSRAALRAAPYRATSLVEDVEYGIDLAEAGVLVEYAPEVHVLSDVPAFSRGAGEQRRRWEDGRRSLLWRVPSLVGLGLRRRDAMLLDLAADLLIPPLSILAAAAAFGFATSFALHLELAAALHGVSLMLVAAYVLRGWALSGTGVRGLAALAHAPAYLVWKLGLALAPDRRSAWRERSPVPRAA